MISMAAGTMPVAMTRDTVLHASATLMKSNSSVLTPSGVGSNRTQISVTIAHVPSLPATTLNRSKSGESSASPPNVTAVPSASTTVAPSR